MTYISRRVFLSICALAGLPIKVSAQTAGTISRADSDAAARERPHAQVGDWAWVSSHDSTTLLHNSRTVQVYAAADLQSPNRVYVNLHHFLKIGSKHGAVTRIEIDGVDWRAMHYSRIAQKLPGGFRYAGTIEFGVPVNGRDIRQITYYLTDKTGKTLRYEVGAAYFMAAFRQARNAHYKLRDRMGLGRSVSQGCFLTTAACQVLQLPDDCWELTQMRRLRDEHAMRTQEGREMVNAYYREAPEIVEMLSLGAAGTRQLVVIYWSIILPCAILMRIGAPRIATRLYTAAFARLRIPRAGPPLRQ